MADANGKSDDRARPCPAPGTRGGRRPGAREPGRTRAGADRGGNIRFEAKSGCHHIRFFGLGNGEFGLLEALEDGSGEEKFDSAHIAGTEGGLRGKRIGLSLVAVTGRFVLASLTAYDMRMALPGRDPVERRESRF